MSFASWLRNLRSQNHHRQDNRRLVRPGRSRTKRTGCKLTLESLEDRTLLSAYLVTTTADTGSGSLRDAINQINLDTSHALYASPSNPNVDEIDFNIPTSDAGYNSGTGAFTIQPSAAPTLNSSATGLPIITNSVIIDGYTQPGASANTLADGDNAVINIELDGANAGTTGMGLYLYAANCTIEGLAVNRFQVHAILALKNGTTIAGNFIGTDVTGTVALPNSTGPYFAEDPYSAAVVLESSNDLVGGADPAARNVISGNFTNGVYIVGSMNTTVEGNFIGTDVTGTQPLGNATNGIFIGGAEESATIGGTTAAARNIISSNAANGVLDGAGYLDAIEGNYIGTDVSGTQALGNAANGLQAGGYSVTIGGTAPGAGNVISGNNESGVSIGGVSGCQVEGNLIGTDFTGTAPLGNGTGITAGDYTGVVIGGTNPDARNVISGNSGTGIILSAQGVQIQGNFIGTDITGTVPLSNPGGGGIYVGYSSENNTIGGTAPGAGNVIAGIGYAVYMSGSGVQGNTIQGNFIGTDLSGTFELGSYGIVIDGGASNNTIGGTEPGAGNVVANEVYSAGVTVNSGTGNTIRGNSIYDNANGGIFLNSANDANSNQTFPTLTATTQSASGTFVAGTLASAPNSTFTIDFYANSAPDPSGYGQGQYYLGSTTVNTDDNGNASFTATLGALPAGAQYVSATATDAAGDTSQFSADFQAGRQPGPYVVTTTADSGPGSLRDAINQIDLDTGDSLYPSATHPNVDEIDFDITAASDTGGGFNPVTGVTTITPLSALPAITNGVFIEGDSEPGFSDAPIIELDGASAGSGVAGLSITAGSSKVMGLDIGGFSGDGIDLTTAGGDTIQGDYIGTNLTGTAALGNGGNGIYATSAYNLIGGTAAGAGNLISGNTGDGILISGSTATGNVIQGNYLGTNAAGTAAMGNGPAGILLANGAANNTVGGSSAISQATGLLSGQGNLVSGNRGGGIWIQTSTGDVVQGNFIGTNAAGTASVTNGYNPPSGNIVNGVYYNDGIDMSDGASNNTIGGVSTVDAFGNLTGLGNLISGNTSGLSIAPSAGIFMQENYGPGNPLVGDIFQGNFIGTDVTGTKSLGNGDYGFELGGGVSNDLFGGTAPGTGNLVSGNANSAIIFYDNFGFGSTTGDTLQGNKIGTDVTGTQLLANGGHGILVWQGASNITIGGTTPGAGNIIAGAGGNPSSTGFGIELISPTPGDVVQGNYIGTNPAGASGLGNRAAGIYIQGTSTTGITIGGSAAGAGNVISGNNGYGIEVLSSQNNVIQGNYIGVNPAGTAALPNTSYGIYLNGSSNITIGGVTSAVGTGAGNVISGNSSGGIVVSSGSNDNVLRGNIVGANAAGTARVSNGAYGIFVAGTSNEIGGSSSVNPTTGKLMGAGNLLSGNLHSGVEIDGGTADLVQGNFIGTDVTGTIALGNDPTGNYDGVDIFAGMNNAIGGASSVDANGNFSGYGNLISGNQGSSTGEVADGVYMSTPNNVVQGNFIGTNVKGTSALANKGSGVKISGAAGNLVGGTAPGLGNLLSGNQTYGVYITGSGAHNTVVEGNVIGTDITGTQAIPNAIGIYILTASNNSIGGTAAGAGNMIAYNSGIGVTVIGSTSTGDAIRGNSIYDNGALGIDLGADGVTPNAPGGPHAGPNNLQNFPVLTGADGGAALAVSGTLNSAPSTTFAIDFFASPTADVSGYGQGEYYLGTTTIVTDATGNALFSTSFSAAALPGGNLPAGWAISATATDPGGNTSEFAQDVVVSVPLSIGTQPASATIDNGQIDTLSVIASNGTSPYSYQWYMGSSGNTANPISGATGSSYTASPTSTTSYWVLVSDDAGATVDSSTATITVVGVSIAGDVDVLNQTASGALTISGNARLTVADTLQVDSSSASAVNLSGNAEVNAAQTLIVGGDQVSGNAYFKNAPTTHAAYIADPLANLAAPTGGASYAAVNLAGNGTLTINPGVYPSITVSGNARLILNPGIYIIGSGGITISGNATVTGGTTSGGQGVLLYNNGAVTISGNGSVNMTAFSTGSYAGLAIYQAQNNASAVTVSGNANLNLNGSVLFAANVQSVVTISGNAQLEASLVVNELTISGNSDDNGQ